MPAASINDVSPGAFDQIEAAVRAADQQEDGEATNPHGVLRVPFLITCRLWEEHGVSTFAGTRPGLRFITMPVNPTKVIHRHGHRMQEEKTAGGRALHTWKHRHRRSFADEPLLTFNFHSGNLASGRQAENGALIPATGRRAMLELIRLLDEEKAIPSKVNGKTITKGVGEPNFVRITYQSILFPFVTLEGFFTPEGLEWVDDADRPLEIMPTMNFVVYDSAPRFSDAGAMMDSFMANASV